MSESPVLMEIDKPHFLVKLRRDLLEIDLKEGFKKDLETLVEARPILRDTLGWLMQSVIPLDVPVKDMLSARVNDRGHTEISQGGSPVPKTIVLPLEAGESEKLVGKLTKLIQEAKEKLALAEKLGEEVERERDEAFKHARMRKP